MNVNGRYHFSKQYSIIITSIYPQCFQCCYHGVVARDGINAFDNVYQHIQEVMIFLKMVSSFRGQQFL